MHILIRIIAVVLCIGSGVIAEATPRRLQVPPDAAMGRTTTIQATDPYSTMADNLSFETFTGPDVLFRPGPREGLRRPPVRAGATVSRKCVAVY
jgi:hypothetical protein